MTLFCKALALSSESVPAQSVVVVNVSLHASVNVPLPLLLRLLSVLSRSERNVTDCPLVSMEYAWPVAALKRLE